MNTSQRTQPGCPGRLRLRFSLLTISAIALLGAVAGTAEETNAPARLSYDSFRVISDRNIFNPNRFARSSGRTRTESRPASRVDAFTLVGLMSYDKGVFAFFDGTNPDYRKTLQSTGTISEFKIASLDPRQVKLVSGTNEFTLHVGMQVRREDEGDWFLTEPSQTTRGRVVVSRGRSRTAHGDGTPGLEGMAEGGTNAEPEIIVMEAEPTEGADFNGNGDAVGTVTNGNGVTDPVLLRLMQRRQELNQ